MSLYEVLRDDAITAPSAAESMDDASDAGLRLVQRRRISARRPGWEVFKLRSVLQRWVDDPSSNRGNHAHIHTYIHTLDNAHNSQAQGLNLRRGRSLGSKRTVGINDERTDGFLDEI